MDIVVTEVHMPTTTCEEDEIDTMHDMIADVMGDWNATVGECADTKFIAKYGLGKRNSIGYKLVEFCRIIICHRHLAPT